MRALLVAVHENGSKSSTVREIAGKSQASAHSRGTRHAAT